MKKNKVGRPSKYNPDFCDKVLEFGRDGMSKLEMAAELGVSRDTLYEWCKVHPDFSDTIKRAIELSQAWWEKRGRIATFGGCEGFNPTSYIFTMKNRFREDWADKSITELTGPDGGPIEQQSSLVITPEIEEEIKTIKGISDSMVKPEGIK